MMLLLRGQEEEPVKYCPGKSQKLPSLGTLQVSSSSSPCLVPASLRAPNGGFILQAASPWGHLVYLESPMRKLQLVWSEMSFSEWPSFGGLEDSLSQLRLLSSLHCDCVCVSVRGGAFPLSYF